jgi:hypothetical protein
MLMMNEIGLVSLKVGLDYSNVDSTRNDVNKLVPDVKLTVTGPYANHINDDTFSGSKNIPHKVVDESSKTTINGHIKDNQTVKSFTFANSIQSNGSTFMSSLEGLINSPEKSKAFQEHYSENEFKLIVTANALLPAENKDQNLKDMVDILGFKSSKIDFKDFEKTFEYINSEMQRYSKMDGREFSEEASAKLKDATKLLTDRAIVTEATKKLDGIQLDEKTKETTRINTDEFIFIRSASTLLEKDDGKFSREDAEKIKKMADELLKTGIEFRRGESFDIGKLSQTTGISEDLLQKASKVDDVSKLR